MASNTADLAGSPEAKEQDSPWQLHSSTDSYLNWTPASNSQGAPSSRYRDVDGPSSSSNPSQKAEPLSPKTPPTFQGTSSMASGSTDASSVVSLDGHATSPQRSTSPSYFERLYLQGQSRTNAGSSPAITFSSASSEPVVKADANVSSHAFIPSEATTQSQPTEVGPSSASASKGLQLPTGAPLSPTASAKSGIGGTGFLSSKLPSPPVNAQPASQRGAEVDSVSRSRRPSSVFEHVGNVWERFGRKVHNVRTSEPPPPPHSRRSPSQTRVSVAPDSEEGPDIQRGSISSSNQSQPSPTQLTHLDTSEQAVSPALPSAGSSSSGRHNSTSSSGRADPAASATRSEDDDAEELPYLAPAPRPVPGPPANTSQVSIQSHRRTSSAFERVLIQVTDDNERFSVVDISGVNSADAIKERMLAKLHLFDADFSSFQLFRTEVGQSEATGHTVNDDALLVLCLQMGDDRGTLKFLIQQIAPPSNSTVRAMPPPISSGVLPRINDSSRGPSTTGSSASQRLRSGSQSSKSSVSDALAFTDSFGSGEDVSNRNSGSSLTRAKAQARRTHPNAPSSEDARSPVHSGGAYQQASQDRRSIGSSTDSPAHERSTRSDVLRNVSSEAGLGSKAGALSYAQQHSGINGRRSSQAELARKRMDEDGAPQRLVNASNQRNQRLERSEGGIPDQQKQNGSPSLMIHNTKSMDDLRHQQSDSAVHHELKLHPSFDRDGRYPDPAIMRPSTAAPATGRESGYGHRQYSSEAQAESMASSMPSQPDARLLTRNRSAQAALPGGAQLSNQGSQQQPIPPQLRSPSLLVQHANPLDPRFSRSDDPRYGPSAGYSSHTVPRRSGNVVARPQYTSPPTYSYPNLPFQQPSRMSVPSPGHLGEFGARGPTQTLNTYHGHDLRLSNHRQVPPTPRPYSYHEQPQSLPYVRPFAQQNVSTSVYHPREDPFTTRYFPASSSRQVSEFQLKAGHLQPGMTVQETLRTKTPGTPGAPYHGQQYPSGPTYGPRDPRQVGPTPSAAVYQGQSPAPMQQQGLSQHQLHHPQQQVHPSQHPHQQQVRQPQPQPPHQHQHPQQHPEHAASHGQSQFRNPYDRPASMFETKVSPPQGQVPHASSAVRGHQKQLPSSGAEAEMYQRRSTSRPNTSERSSGSSFGSQSNSHGRHHSAEEERRGRGSMEDSFITPPSARSSQSGAVLPKPGEQDSRRSYPSTRHDGDLPDDELAHVRPLPQPPGSPMTEAQRNRASQDRSRVPTGRKSEEEDTLRAGDWASLWKALDPKSSGDSMSGTAISGSSGGDGDTLRADSGTPGHMSRTDGDTVTPELRSRLQRVSNMSSAPDENGTVASFDTFDDDDSESGTWAQPLDSKVDAPRLPVRTASDRGSFGSGDHGTLHPNSSSITFLPGNNQDPIAAASSLRRPELRLTIDPAVGPTQMGPSSSRQSGNSPLPNSAHPSSSGVSRSNSFAQTDNDWAFRPPPEQLYENLDNFFPKHDLDKPLLDTAAVPDNTAVSSPRSESSPVTLLSPANLSASATQQQQQHLLGQRGRHKKSIRLVAQDRKRFLDKTEKRPTSQESETSGGLLRRRSTKLWGTKVIEMTPGQELAAPASAISADSPSSDTSVRPVFKWVKGDLIGKGTYGRVYLALNATTGEMIAVKQVELPRTASDREDSRQKGVVAALKSEIETLKDLDHPHIVSYLGFEETSSFLSIFLEYVPGGSVGSCLRKHGKFEEQTIKSFLHQILEGLAYLHSKGILHRDLKADNILVDFEGICRISDFGTVRRSDDIYGNVENMSLQGSIFWMAPEVVSLSKKGYSAKVDIWSLGCVVLEMFAGRRPWSEDEAVQAMFKIGAERKAPPIPADVKLSKQAAHFLRNCFEVDPAKRPTAQRLLDHVFSVTEPDWRFQQSALFRSLHR